MCESLFYRWNLNVEMEPKIKADKFFKLSISTESADTPIQITVHYAPSSPQGSF